MARVRMLPGSGSITVNKRSLDDYFPNNVLKMVIKQPLLSTETAERFDIHVTVAGGGPSGKAGPILAGNAPPPPPPNPRTARERKKAAARAERPLETGVQ